jgi:outer membrane protein TolC
MKRRLIGIVFFGLCTYPSSGQTVSVEEVVQLSLQKNFDVKLLENSVALANNDNRFGFSVFIPTINATGTTQRSTNNSRNLPFNLPENVNPSAKSINTNANVQLVWTLFDGTRMFATRRRISNMFELSKLNSRNQMINTAANAITLYYGIARQEQQYKAVQEQVSVSEERVKLAERKLQVGTGGKPELLQAKVDLNAFRTAILLQETLIQQLKDQLNGALGGELPPNFEVSDSIPFDHSITFDQIAEDIENHNLQLASIRQSIEVASNQLQEARAGRSPIINFIGGINVINRQENEVQVTPATQQYTQSSGYNYGLQVQIPLVNAMNVNRTIGQTRINKARQQLIYDQQSLVVMVNVRVAFASYDNARRTLVIEEENILLAKENVTIALEGFRRGITTFIELRTAQQSLADAYNRLIAARFNAKVSETELLRLRGSLIN